MEFSFKDVLRIIKKNIVFILVVSVVAALATFFVTKFFVPKTYTSSVRLYVNVNNSNATSAESLSSHSLAQKMVPTYIKLLDTHQFYENVSKELKEKYSPSRLKAMVSFTEDENTEVFNAVVKADDPGKAKTVADAVAKVAPETISEMLDHNAQLKIVDEAQIPQSPTSPNTSRNVIIAFVAGLVVALVISFLRDYFDVKIKYDEEMTTICGLPVLSAIPEFSTGGADDSKSSDSSDSESDSE